MEHESQNAKYSPISAGLLSVCVGFSDSPGHNQNLISANSDTGFYLAYSHHILHLPLKCNWSGNVIAPFHMKIQV